MAENGNRRLYGNHSPALKRRKASWWRCPNIQGRVASLISSLAGALSHVTRNTDSSLPWKHFKILLINPIGHVHFIRIFTASPTILRWMVLESVLVFLRDSVRLPSATDPKPPIGRLAIRVQFKEAVSLGSSLESECELPKEICQKLSQKAD